MLEFLKTKTNPLKINWSALQQVEIDNFVAECNEKAKQYDAFDVSISKRLYDYLFSNPSLWGNFVLSTYANLFDGMVIVAKDSVALKDHSEKR